MLSYKSESFLEGPRLHGSTKEVIKEPRTEELIAKKTGRAQSWDEGQRTGPSCSKQRKFNELVKRSSR